jgi:hypothetical protein
MAADRPGEVGAHILFLLSFKLIMHPAWNRVQREIEFRDRYAQDQVLSYHLIAHCLCL